MLGNPTETPSPRFLSSYCTVFLSLVQLFSLIKKWVVCCPFTILLSPWSCVEAVAPSSCSRRAEEAAALAFSFLPV